MLRIVACLPWGAISASAQFTIEDINPGSAGAAILAGENLAVEAMIRPLTSGPIVGGHYSIRGGVGEAQDSPSAAPPTLHVQRDGDRILLTWSADAGAFVLEQCPSLVGASWTEVAAAPEVVGGEMRVLQEPEEGTLFYRLRRR